MKMDAVDVVADRTIAGVNKIVGDEIDALARIDLIVQRDGCAVTHHEADGAVKPFPVVGVGDKGHGHGADIIVVCHIAEVAGRVVGLIHGNIVIGVVAAGVIRAVIQRAVIRQRRKTNVIQRAAGFALALGGKVGGLEGDGTAAGDLVVESAFSAAGSRVLRAEGGEGDGDVVELFRLVLRGVIGNVHQMDLEVDDGGSVFRRNEVDVAHIRRGRPIEPLIGGHLIVVDVLVTVVVVQRALGRLGQRKGDVGDIVQIDGDAVLFLTMFSSCIISFKQTAWEPDL